MTHDQAVRLAVECMTLEFHRLAVPASLHERFGADMPHAVNASKRRTDLRQAMQLISGQLALKGLT